MGLFYSPLNAVAEYYAVCGIVRRKCRAAILHAEHHERFCAVVAHTASAVGCHAHHTAFYVGNDLSVNLNYPFTPRKK